MNSFRKGHSVLLRRALAASIAAGGTVAAGGAAAVDGHSVLINAVLLSKNICRFGTGGSLISLSIDPAATAPIVATGSITFRCEGTGNPASYGVSNNNGQNGSSPTALRMRITGTTDTMGYSLSYPPTGSVPKNTTSTLTVTVSVAPGEFQNALPGTYSDTVTLSIAP